MNLEVKRRVALGAGCPHRDKGRCGERSQDVSRVPGPVGRAVAKGPGSGVSGVLATSSPQSLGSESSESPKDFGLNFVGV